MPPFGSSAGKEVGNIAVYGYIRISTREQNEDWQLVALHELNIPERNIYMDKQSGKELMTQDEIAVMDGGKCILQVRGVRPFFSDKFDITKHTILNCVDIILFYTKSTPSVCLIHPISKQQPLDVILL